MKTSWLAAAGVTIALAAWMASGLLRGDDADGDGDGGADDPVAIAGGDAPGPAPVRVEVTVAEPAPERRTVTLRGELAAARTLTLRARTAGPVAELPVARGMRVEADAPLVRLDAGTRGARLAAARAQLASAVAEREAAESLGRSGLQSRLRAEQAIAAASLARAEVDRLEEDLDDTVIRAPFAGLVEALPVELGALVERGEPVATLVDDSAFDVAARAAQQVAARLEPGRRVEVALITGETLRGTLAWVASVADPATRSFEIEARIENPGTALAAGVSATLTVPLETVEALFLSPSTLTLGEGGELGVKALDAEDRVVFRPVELLSTSLDGAWVTGIESGERIVTLGQGFVGVGERVLPSPASEPPPVPPAPATGAAEPVVGAASGATAAAAAETADGAPGGAPSR